MAKGPGILEYLKLLQDQIERIDTRQHHTFWQLIGFAGAILLVIVTVALWLNSQLLEIHEAIAKLDGRLPGRTEAARSNEDMSASEKLRQMATSIDSINARQTAIEALMKNNVRPIVINTGPRPSAPRHTVTRRHRHNHRR